MRENHRTPRARRFTRRQLVFFGTLGLLCFPGPAPAMDPAGEFVGEESATKVAEGEELLIGLSVPLLSPLFEKTPVAVVDEEPITVGDLTRRIASTHAERAGQATTAAKNYAELLRRVITTQLVVQEARNIGFDELPEIEKDIEQFETKWLVSNLVEAQLEGVEPTPEEVDALYAKLSREVLMIALEFEREEDALAFAERCADGADFEELARRFVEEGRAEGDLEGAVYMKLKDLMPMIAQAAYEMEEGSVSSIFAAGEGRYLVFYLEGSRFYEDPSVRDEARQALLEPLRKTLAGEYIDALIAKHSSVDDDLLEELDFEVERSGFLWTRKEEPADFEKLLADTRLLATVHGDEPYVVTVGDLSRALEARQYHGVDDAAQRRNLNRKKRPVLRDILLKKAGRIEAASQGLDQSEAYLDAVDEHTTSVLFGTFVGKVITPGIAIEEEELRTYYDSHPDEFSTPTMLRMTSLAFYELADAESALAKLRKGADFKWVSANSAGQVDKEDQRAALFEDSLVSSTALPEDLHEATHDAREGDALVYRGSEGRYHVIVIETVFPAAPRPYAGSREAIAGILYQQKVQESIESWGEKLREAYETRIFVTDLGD